MEALSRPAFQGPGTRVSYSHCSLHSFQNDYCGIDLSLKQQVYLMPTTFFHLLHRYDKVYQLHSCMQIYHGIVLNPSTILSVPRRPVLVCLLCVHRTLQQILLSSSPLPKIRRQIVFQAFSVPGTEQLQKLLSVGPSIRFIFSVTTARNLTTTPKGNNFGRNIGSVFFQGLGAKL